MNTDQQPTVSAPYATFGQKRHAAMMGMYIFLGSEFMLFSGIFTVVAYLRLEHPAEVAAASKEMHYLLAGINTAVLLTSSLLVALAVEAARAGHGRKSSLRLAAASFLGVLFLALKAYEYAKECQEGILPAGTCGIEFQSPTQHLFMNLYLVATALHAVHLTVGVLLIGMLAGALRRGWIALPERSMLVIGPGIYWHFVDVIWIFLYPVFYLAR